MDTARKIAQFLIVFFIAGSMSLSAAAADNGDGERAQAILVLDGSGSMWGLINDTPKISVAQEVIRDLLGDWDPNVDLGVTAYGHREKGNCADIETLVPIGPVDRDRVMAAIEGLNPKGKTPLTDAVRQAADALRYTEERATVILVSDGKETCDADPCAVAQELEASGIDFTVHVVGFDLDAEEKTQLQCMADNTGGKFLSADNASELREAMTATVQLVAEPEPMPKRVIKLQTAPVGTLTVQNITGDHVYVYEPGQTYKDDIDFFTSQKAKTAQLKAGTYMLGTEGQQLTEVDIAPGEEVVIDMKDFFGTLTVQNITGGPVYVYEPGQTFKDDIDFFTSQKAKTAQLKAGTYMLGTEGQQLTEVDIAPGEEVVVDMEDFFGWLTVQNITGDHVYVYEPGQTYKDDIDFFTSQKAKTAQLKAGTYMLGTEGQQLTQVDIAPGEEAVVDMKDFFGTLTVQNITGGPVYVYEPGQTFKDDIDFFTSQRAKTAQLKAGTYMLGTAGQQLTEVDIAPGEEVVVDMEDFFGWLTVQNITGDHVYVYEPGQTYKDDIDFFTSQKAKTAQLKAGTYMLGTAKHELTTLEIAPGEEVVVDLGG